MELVGESSRRTQLSVCGCSLWSSNQGFPGMDGKSASVHPCPSHAFPPGVQTDSFSVSVRYRSGVTRTLLLAPCSSSGHCPLAPIHVPGWVALCLTWWIGAGTEKPAVHFDCFWWSPLHLRDIPKGEAERRGAVLQEEIFLLRSPLHLQSLFPAATYPLTQEMQRRCSSVYTELWYILIFRERLSYLVMSSTF